MQEEKKKLAQWAKEKQRLQEEKRKLKQQEQEEKKWIQEEKKKLTLSGLIFEGRG